MLPHRCVTANIDAIDGALELDYDLDRAASWLPLYHDMGLIGMLMIPMTTGTELVLAGPQDFLAAPSRWAQWISDFHCTITAGPNFSYALSARAMRRRRPRPEPVARRAERRRADRAQLGRGLARRRRPARPAGRHRVLRLRHGRVHRRHHVPGAGQGHDRRLGRRPRAGDRRLRRAGGPVGAGVAPAAVPRKGDRGPGAPGRRARHRDSAARPRSGRARGAGIVGHPGYFRNERATAEVFHDEWLRTGDLGYLVDGELIICGRLKDVIIVGGRNVFPEDIERAAAAVEGVRAGNVIAFGAPGPQGAASPSWSSRRPAPTTPSPCATRWRPG